MSGYEQTKFNTKLGHPGNSIKEVFIDNLDEEIKNIANLIDMYPFVSMDTEFPGIVYNSSNYKIVDNSTYSNIKINVDRLKVIQVGITLSDVDGNLPYEFSTWQFNIDFNLKTDNFSQESIQLLMSSGIDFSVLPQRGIPVERFGEVLITSGLILNENINWITFHGSYDFAYLLRVITGQLLPDKVELFNKDLDLYFQNYFDIRQLIQYQDSFRGSLNKLAYDLNIERTGLQHQAGSDALVTSKVFFKLRDLNYITDEDILKGKNQLFNLNSYDEVSTSYTIYQDMNNNQYFNGYGYNLDNMNLGYSQYDNTGMMYGGLNNQNFGFYNNMPKFNAQGYQIDNNEVMNKEKNATNLLSQTTNQVNTVGVSKSNKQQKKILKGV